MADVWMVWGCMVFAVVVPMVFEAWVLLHLEDSTLYLVT